MRLIFTNDQIALILLIKIISFKKNSFKLESCWHGYFFHFLTLFLHLLVAFEQQYLVLMGYYINYHAL